MPWPKGKPKLPPVRKANPDEIKRLYVDEKLSIEKVAKRLQLGKTTVATWLRKLGVQRNVSQATKLYGSQRAEHNHNWHGGRKLKNGYIYVYKPGHPIALARKTYNPYIAEHIIVWEETHGRQLPHGWVVHHINGVRSDNRPNNLLAVPKAHHSPALRVKEVQKRLRVVEAELKRVKTQLSLELSSQ